MTDRDGEEIVERHIGTHGRGGINRREFNRRALGVVMSAVPGAGLASVLGARPASAQTPRGIG